MAITPSDAATPPTDLHGVILDMLAVGDQEAAARRLLQKLASFSTGAVDIVEIGETALCLQQSDGTPHQFRIHPQGMEVDRNTGLLYITAVEIIEQRDKARRFCGKGRAHLFECDTQGKTVRSTTLTSDNEDEYHPSGMVLIDDTMFIALAQYLPETSATIIKFDVRSWSYEKLFRIQDHVGLVVPNLLEDELLLGNWGTRHYYRTDLKGNIKRKQPNPCSDGMEHQDAQLMSGRFATFQSIKPGMKFGSIEPMGSIMLATGVTAGGMEYFGLEIIDVTSWTIMASLRWPSATHITRGGWAPFANPTFLWLDCHDRILALATPDDVHEPMGKHAKLLLYTLFQRKG